MSVSDNPQPARGISSNAARAVSRELWVFFTLTFAMSWGLGGLYLLFHAQLDPFFGPMGPHNAVFYVVAWAPTVSAFLAALTLGGTTGCKALLARLVRPFHPGWLVVAALIVPTIALVLTLSLPRLGFPNWPVTPRAVFVALPAVLFGSAQIVTNTGPLGEELGWRGYALPRLLTRSNAFLAAIVLGAVWTVWHVPAFFIAGVMGQSLAGFGWWSLDTFALSITMTWLFLRANGNVIVAGVIPHFVTNGMGVVGAWLSRPPEAAALAVVAICLVLADRRRFFRRPDDAPL